MQTLEVMVDAVLPDWPPLPSETRAKVSRNVAAFVSLNLDHAPLQIRLGFHALLSAFRLYALTRLGPRRLEHVSPAEREKALTGFSSLRLPMAPNLERILRSLTMLAYLEDPAVVKALGEGTLLAPSRSVAAFSFDPMTVITSVWPVEERGAIRREILIVGTGAGGASVAATLAEAGCDVLMVEEGPHVPLDRAPTTLSESMLRLWRGGGLTATLGHPPISFAEGRCVGGGTEINSAIFQRAPDAVLDSWANASRADGLRPGPLAPYYDRAASIVHASLTDGEAGPPTAILERAGRAMQWQVVTLERARLDGGPSRQRISGFATGTKQSMTLTLIPRALEAGARLLPDCRILRLKSKRRRVEGAEAEIVDQEGKRRRVDIAASHVFLCAGATQTSGLAAAERYWL